MTFAKLCALLFFTDIESYKVTGKPISGATYIKEEFGCYPLGLREVLDKLAKQGRIRGWRGEGESSDE